VSLSSSRKERRATEEETNDALFFSFFFFASVYTGLMYCFLMGAVAPIPFYFLAKKWPTSLIAKTHVPVLIYVSLNREKNRETTRPELTFFSLCHYRCQKGFLTYGPYSTMANVWPGVVVAYVFQVYIKRRYLAWWSKCEFAATSSPFSPFLHVLY